MQKSAGVVIGFLFILSTFGLERLAKNGRSDYPNVKLCQLQVMRNYFDDAQMGVAVCKKYNYKAIQDAEFETYLKDTYNPNLISFAMSYFDSSVKKYQTLEQSVNFIRYLIYRTNPSMEDVEDCFRVVLDHSSRGVFGHERLFGPLYYRVFQAKPEDKKYLLFSLINYLDKACYSSKVPPATQELIEKSYCIVMDQLIRLGISLNVTSQKIPSLAKKPYTPLSHAFHKGQRAVVALLKKHNASFFAENLFVDKKTHDEIIDAICSGARSPDKSIIKNELAAELARKKDRLQESVRTEDSYFSTLPIDIFRMLLNQFYWGSVDVPKKD